MAGTIERFFAANTFIVSSVAAQAFFMLGLALAVQYWRHSTVQCDQCAGTTVLLEVPWAKAAKADAIRQPATTTFPPVGRPPG